LEKTVISSPGAIEGLETGECMSDKTNLTAAPTKTHNYGIDALRMLAMFMVVTTHVLGPGGILDNAPMGSLSYEAAWFLEIACYCTVNCYALISGYVGGSAKYRYHSILLLWLRVAFYTLSLTLIFSIAVPGAVTLKHWVFALLPVTYGGYWYFTSYFALFFFLPLLNIGLCRLGEKQLRAVAIGLVLVFSFVQAISGGDIFSISSNAWWLMILYIIGGYIGKYGLFPKWGAARMFLGYLLMTSLTWLSKVFIESGIFPPLEALGGKYLVNHTAPAMLGAGVFLLLAFQRITFPKRAEGIIRFFSPMAFSVYLIHANPFVWDHLLSQRFAWFAQLSAPLEIGLTLLTTLAIYLSCSLADLIRIGIFKALKLKPRLAGLEEKYLGGLWQ